MSGDEGITADELRELCTLVVELTRLRQSECKHLSVENFAPELLRNLIAAFAEANGSAPLGSLLAVRAGA